MSSDNETSFKVTLDIDAHRSLRIFCFETGQTMKSVVQKAVAQIVEHERLTIKKARESIGNKRHGG